METKERVREMLRRCCLHHEGCCADGFHACDRVSPQAFEELSTPGHLVREGPLSLEAQGKMRELTGLEPTTDNRVRLLVDGTQSYQAMLDIVEGSEREILFENYIFRTDALGRGFANALRRRAEEGVDVRVLHDPVGSISSFRLPIGFSLRNTPVAVRVYNPPRPARSFLRYGRDHRKVVVGDRRRAVTGGICIADIWSGNCVTHCTWRDSAVLVEGGAAREVAGEFDRMWERGISFTARVEGRSAGDEAEDHPAGTLGGVPVRVVADEPRRRRMERVLEVAFGAARQEILLTNPYVIPPGPLVTALAAAARRGVDVRILFPRTNNPRVVGLAVEHALGPLLSAGVRAWHWEGPLIHAKTVVVDRCWTLIGSSNLDPLSMRKLAELNLEIHGAAFGNQMAEVFFRDLERSTEVSPGAWRKRPFFRRLLTGAAYSTRSWQ